MKDRKVDASINCKPTGIKRSWPKRRKIRPSSLGFCLSMYHSFIVLMEGRFTNNCV